MRSSRCSSWPPIGSSCRSGWATHRSLETLVAATDWALAHRLEDRLWFYEDFYALAGTMRGRHPVARQRMWGRMRSPLLHARRLGVILARSRRTSRGPSVDTFLAPALRDARWHVTTSDVRAHEERKLAAIACYRSQTRAFGGLSGIARATRHYHAWWGGAEPLGAPSTPGVILA